MRPHEFSKVKPNSPSGDQEALGECETPFSRFCQNNMRILKTHGDVSQDHSGEEKGDHPEEILPRKPAFFPPKDEQ